MRKLSLALLALSIMLVQTADGNAQLLDKVKKKAKETVKADDPSRSRPPARTDQERTYAPGLSFSTVLNGVQLLAKNGQFRLGSIQTTFLSDECSLGWTVLRTADGKEICQFDWRPDRLKKPYALINIHKITDLRTGNSVSGGVDLATPGDYVLDFYIPTEHFYTFPFSVAKISSEDPFAGEDCYVLQGAWEDWGYLYYRDAKADQSLYWKIWLHSNALEPVDAKIDVAITRDGDGELVCTSRGSISHRLRPEWTRYEFDMIFPMELTSGGAYFKAQDLLATDGAYTLTMKINGQPYGSWHFSVTDGKLVYSGRTLRGEATPLTFVEGGQDAWWYSKWVGRPACIGRGWGNLPPDRNPMIVATLY